MTKTASKESVEAGRNLLYNLDGTFNFNKAAKLESFEFKPSKKNPGVAVLHYKLTDGPKRACLACMASDAGVITINKKTGEYEYTGKSVIVLEGQLTLAN